jgi:hypothetical protein
MGIIKLTDEKPDAVLPNEPNSPTPTEPVEFWSFLFKGGIQKDFTIHTGRNEKVLIVKNAIDQTPVEVQIYLREGTDGKNEVTGALRINLSNVLIWGKEDGVEEIYAPGESPVEKELKRLADQQQQRAEAFERRQAEKEAAFDAEMASIENRQ